MSIAVTSSDLRATTLGLGSVADIIMGQAPPGSDCNQEGKGTIFVKAGEFAERFPLVREWTTRPLKLAQSGDVLVCVVGATAGKINQAIDCAIGRSVAAVRPSSKLLTEYLYHFLSTKVNLLRAKSQGLAQGVITREMLHELSIPLLRLAEQRRIAQVLDRAEELRTKRRCALAQLDSLTQSIFLDLFGDPVRNQRSFPAKRLIELVDPERGISYGVVQRGDDVDDGVPVVRITDVVGGEIVPTALKRTSTEIAGKYRRTVLRGGELVISIRGTIGRCALVPKQLAGGNITRELALIPHLGLDPSFLLSLLRADAVQRLIIGDVKGIAQRGINLKDLRELPVILPPEADVNEFARRITAVEKLKTAQRASLASLDALFATLQHRAFNGELFSEKDRESLVA